MDAPSRKLCAECNNKVPVFHYLNHLRLCRTPQYAFRKEGSQEKPGINCEGLLREIKARKPSETSRITVNKAFKGLKPREEPIQCPKCTETVSTATIEYHAKRCKYLECSYCQSYYPKALLRQHRKNCSRRQGRAANKRNIPSDDLNTPANSNPAVARRRGGDAHGLPRFVTSEGEEFGSEIQPRLLGQLYVPMRVLEQTSHGIVTTKVLIPVESTQLGMLDTPIGFNNSDFEWYNRSFDDPNATENHPGALSHDTRESGSGFIKNLFEQLLSITKGSEPKDYDTVETLRYKRPATVNANEEEKCTICIGEFKDNERVKKLPCRHVYHPTCIDTWLARNAHCPLCKRRVRHAIGSNVF